MASSTMHQIRGRHTAEPLNIRISNIISISINISINHDINMNVTMISIDISIRFNINRKQSSL